MPNTKVRAKKSYKCFEGIFQEGDILTIEPVLYEKDTVIVKEWWRKFYPEQSKGFILTTLGEPVNHKMADAVIAKAGSYKTCVLVLSDGRRFPDSLLGSKPLSFFFDKI